MCGGDAIHRGGNNYISTTWAVTGRVGVFGAMNLAFDTGYLVGNALDWHFGCNKNIEQAAYEIS